MIIEMFECSNRMHVKIAVKNTHVDLNYIF
jgi:hypothetical protein